MRHNNLFLILPFLTRGGRFPETRAKFRFVGSIYSMPSSLSTSSSVSARTSSQNPPSFPSSSVPSLSFQRHSPNSFSCMPIFVARIRRSRLNSVSPVRARRAAPRDFWATKLRQVSIRPLRWRKSITLYPYGGTHPRRSRLQPHAAGARPIGRFWSMNRAREGGPCLAISCNRLKELRQECLEFSVRGLCPTAGGTRARRCVFWGCLWVECLLGKERGRGPGEGRSSQCRKNLVRPVD